MKAPAVQAPAAPAIYLDYNATAPLHPVVAERMAALLQGPHGNPSSPHQAGQAAREALETARRSVAQALGVHRARVIFTSGGSEANTWMLRALAEGPPTDSGAPVHCITTPLEHPSILAGAEWLAAHGVAVDYLPVQRNGQVDAEALPGLLRPETRLVSVMAANNETGVLQPLGRIGKLIHKHRPDGGVRFHTDAVQAFGRVPLPLQDWRIDAVTVAAHKLGGPKGIGALAFTGAVEPPPLVLGGAQERGHRAGTESVLLAGGFAAAAEWTLAHRDELAARLTALRGRLEERLLQLPGAFVNGQAEDGTLAPRVPNTSNLGFAGILAQDLLVALDLNGVAVSTGSACSSGALTPSPVLRAMGLEGDRLTGALRLSLGYGSTEEEVDRACEIIATQVARLQTLGASQARAAS